MSANLYERDFYAWANEQAGLLRAGKLSEADLEHIAEEIESMGKSEKRELVNRLSVLLMHLLKWQFQATGRGTSWRLTIFRRKNCKRPWKSWGFKRVAPAISSVGCTTSCARASRSWHHAT